MEKPIWITKIEVAEIVRLHPAHLGRLCAEGRIDPRCGRKMGGAWRFKREVIENEGLLLRDAGQ